ncbi:LacI family DNA-binding transcriptional regulator [Dactylosporangium sp. CA-092794]|uniref:LacI family DNA-binding transcriptional regulator n=1 Tax=Dactylosporangium sp. CA-092794 TaxID=3239929 RepID=UPI003D8B7ECC
MPVRRTHATIAEVARRAGVSQSTVSKAINGTGQLSPETRRRVTQAARELGYQARGLPSTSRGTRTYTVGVLSTDPYGRFTMPILTGAEHALAAGEISMLLCASLGDPIREAHYLRTLVGRRVDGIIVTGASSDARAPVERDLHVPIVYALGASADPRDHSVVPDDRGGARRAIQHLIARGRRSIAVVAGPSRHLANQHRVDTALAAISEAEGVSAASVLYGDWTEAWGRDAAAILLAQFPEVDAVFCTNDQIARGVLDHLREADIDVPGRVGVVGVDNWDVIVDASRPALTSVDLNLHEVGRVAATRLLAAVGGEALPGGIEYVDCHLVARQSS